MQTEFHVLIVDDAFFIRNLIKKTIQKKPDKTLVDGQTITFRVVGEACSGKEGLELCESLKPDIITLDLNMPDINGVDVIHTLHKKMPEIEIIVITSNKNKEITEKVLDLNCRFISKPFQDHLLYKDLNEIAEKRNQTSEPVQEAEPAIKETQKPKAEVPKKKQKPKKKQVDENSIFAKMNQSFTNIHDDEQEEDTFFSKQEQKEEQVEEPSQEEDLVFQVEETSESEQIEEPKEEPQELIFEELEMEPQSEEPEEPEVDTIPEYEEKEPLSLSMEKKDEFDDFDSMDDLVFQVEEEHVEDTISQEMKDFLDKKDEKNPFGEVDEEEYIRFSRNDMGENNEYLDLLMDMTYSYNMDVANNIQMRTAQAKMRRKSEREMEQRLEELQDPNLHSILRESQEQSKLLSAAEAKKEQEKVRDEFDEFDDFVFSEGGEDLFFDETPKSSQSSFSNHGYTIAPPAVNPYETTKVIRDKRPLNQPVEPPKPEKKPGFFARLFGKKKKK